MIHILQQLHVHGLSPHSEETQVQTANDHWAMTNGPTWQLHHGTLWIIHEGDTGWAVLVHTN